ncbi:MAG: hypothetical protein AAB360_00760 [Patescibacteria group bacterium]
MNDKDLNLIIRQLMVLEVAVETIGVLSDPDYINDILLRIKTLRVHTPQKIISTHQHLLETLNKVDSPTTRREQIPPLVRDALTQAGVGTQVPPSQPQARACLLKTIKATEAYIDYFNDYPNQPIDVDKVNEIAIRKLLRQKFGEE